MSERPAETPKREEQVLVLAAGGLTDKEIAIRLGISPDTVGTYWRRVLAKYQASSRTECFAKYMDARASRALENLQFVNECMKLVNDHMLEHGVGDAMPQSIADAILASISQWILVVDSKQSVVFSNRPTPPGSCLVDLLDVEAFESTFELAMQGPVEAEAHHGDDPYEFILSPGTGALTGMAVMCGRPA